MLPPRARTRAGLLPVGLLTARCLLLTCLPACLLAFSLLACQLAHCLPAGLLAPGACPADAIKAYLNASEHGSRSIDLRPSPAAGPSLSHLFHEVQTDRIQRARSPCACVCACGRNLVDSCTCLCVCACVSPGLATLGCARASPATVSSFAPILQRSLFETVGAHSGSPMFGAPKDFGRNNTLAQPTRNGHVLSPFYNQNGSYMDELPVALLERQELRSGDTLRPPNPTKALPRRGAIRSSPRYIRAKLTYKMNSCQLTCRSAIYSICNLPTCPTTPVKFA